MIKVEVDWDEEVSTHHPITVVLGGSYTIVPTISFNAIEESHTMTMKKFFRALWPEAVQTPTPTATSDWAEAGPAVAKEVAAADRAKSHAGRSRTKKPVMTQAVINLNAADVAKRKKK